jgi:hypothetical protein
LARDGEDQPEARLRRRVQANARDFVAAIGPTIRGDGSEVFGPGGAEGDEAGAARDIEDVVARSIGSRFEQPVLGGRQRFLPTGLIVGDGAVPAIALDTTLEFGVHGN